MAWTYQPTLERELDEVRFAIGDTDRDAQQLQDEEITYLLTEHVTVGRAAIVAAENLSAKYARQADRKIGDLTISYSKISQQYSELAQRLRRELSFTGAAPYMGGKTHSDKRVDRDDSDMVKPSFTRGLQDHPGVDYEDLATKRDELFD